MDANDGEKLLAIALIAERICYLQSGDAKFDYDEYVRLHDALILAVKNWRGIL